jgi:hypothetical protein
MEAEPNDLSKRKTCDGCGKKRLPKTHELFGSVDVACHCTSAQKISARRALETSEERAQRLAQMRSYGQRRRDGETEEEKQIRVAKEKIQRKQKRLEKKLLLNSARKVVQAIVLDELRVKEETQNNIVEKEKNPSDLKFVEPPPKKTKEPPIKHETRPEKEKRIIQQNLPAVEIQAFYQSFQSSRQPAIKSSKAITPKRRELDTRAFIILQNDDSEGERFRRRSL